jgi:hypothetical protein
VLISKNNIDVVIPVNEKELRLIVNSSKNLEIIQIVSISTLTLTLQF